MPKLPQTDHPCFPQPDDTSTKVWRYMDLAKLVSLVSDKSLFLSQLPLLNDSHEGSVPQANLEAAKAFGVEVGMPNFVDLMSRGNERNREITYANCWTIRNDESDALWKLYCGGNQGVAVQTTYEKLAAAANGPQMFIGRVTYIDYQQEQIPVGNTFYPVMFKRRAYEYESEVRIVTQLFEHLTTSIDDQVFPGNPPPGTPHAVDLDSLVETVYIHPYAGEWFENCVKAVVRAFAPELEARVQQSSMKIPPVY